MSKFKNVEDLPATRTRLLLFILQSQLVYKAAKKVLKAKGQYRRGKVRSFILQKSIRIFNNFITIAKNLATDKLRRSTR